ncbi:MAG: ABC transporter substrate-binding protein [Anaerolineae bacterium]
MSAGKLSRRTFLTVAAMAASAAAVAACGGTAAPTTVPVQATAAPTAATVEPTATTAAAAEPTATTAAATTPGKYAEAPMLAEMVKAGSLPPVEERLPREPLIQPVVEEIGQYGGTWHRAAVSIGDTSLFYRLYPDGLVYFDIPGELTPAIARKWEMSDDGKEFTFYLREGMKWSDGEPYTADDITFWYEDMVLNDELTPSKPTWLMTKGELGTVSKVDDYTVKFTFSEPYGLFVEWLATLQFFSACKHYLSQFHPNYADKAEIEKAATDNEFESWYQYFGNRNNPYNNPDLPVVGAWHFVTGSDANPMVAERNPYYYRVDEQGQQLPYIDRISWEIVTNAEVLNFKAIAGEIDCQSRHMNLMNYPLLDEGREKGDYRVLTWPGDGGSDAGIIFNQDAGKQEGANDHKKVIGDLLRTLELRQALSVAIDREEIWDSAFLQFGEPRQMAPMQWSKYYEEGMETVFTEFDVDTANQSETALSFLGLGLRPPAISWGVLLQEAQNLRSVALAPWLLVPGAAVVVTVLAFNFMGDGLRDAADPYS